jgi:hypothetical protein
MFWKFSNLSGIQLRGKLNWEENDDDEEKDTGCKNLDETPGMEGPRGALQGDWQFAYEVVIRR